MTVGKPLTTAASLKSWKALPVASHKCNVFHPELRVLIPGGAEDGNPLWSAQLPWRCKP